MKFNILSFYVRRLFSSDREFLDTLHRITRLYPKNVELYKLAFVHSSASLRMPDGTHINNERLEFLGDAILDAIVAEYLYRNFPDKPEGFLSQTRSKIVNGESLAHLATALDINTLIVSHVSHFGTNKSILEDAFEAMIGALYLDQGYRATRKFVVNRLINKYIDIDTVLKTETNYKSQLLEWSQHSKSEVVFNTTAVEGHAFPPQFSSEVVVGTEVAMGHGSTKKEAEQDAARQMLKKLN